MLAVIHMDGEKLPGEIEFGVLYSMAVLIDNYKMHKLVRMLPPK